MAFDYKKEYREFYMPKNKPEIVNVPEFNKVENRNQTSHKKIGIKYRKSKLSEEEK